jgi:hypothetical protein
MRKLLGFSLVASALAGCAFPKVVDTSTGADGAVADSAADVVAMDVAADVADSGVIVRPDVLDVQSDAAADVVSEPRPDVVVEACVPRGAEVCDGIDNDCNGVADDVPAAMLQSNNDHCGSCGNACGTNECALGVCTAYPSNGSEGAFNPPPGMVTTLTPGTHHFTTITIPATAIVRMSAGSGVLELRASGAVNIQGEIDLSGGNGGSSAGRTGMTPGCNIPSYAGGAHGGAAGLGRGPVLPQFDGCKVENVAIGNATDVNGAGGNGGEGAHMGGCGGRGGNNGGGNAGGRRASGGGGGGGIAGGGGGAAGFYNYVPGDRQNAAGGTGGRIGASTVSAGGQSSCTAVMCTATGGGVGETSLGATAGATATVTLSATQGLAVASGGGGGTMGREAFADLSITRLSPGSSGGAGGGGSDPCPAYGYSYGIGGGGGGGGGALRIASTTSITISASGVVSARGGDGGNGNSEVVGGGGGGGSGGAIDLRAPRLTIATAALVTAAGGSGGATTHPNAGNGGNGGPGRIRLAFNTGGACTISAMSFSHTFAGANPCDVARTTALRTVYVTRFPE